MPRNIAGRVAPTKTEVLDLIRAHDARRPGGVTLIAFEEATGINRVRLARLFGGWGDAREAAGLPRRGGRTRRIEDREVYAAMHLVVAKLGRFPTLDEWARFTPFSEGVLQSRGGKKAVQRGYTRWLSIKRQLAALKARKDAGETLTEKEQWMLLRSATEQAADPSREAAAAGDGGWVAEAFGKLRPAFLTHSCSARDWPDDRWGEVDYLVVLEHDWPACRRPAFALERFLPVGGDGAKREALFGPVHDPADRRWPLRGKPPLPKPGESGAQPA